MVLLKRPINQSVFNRPPAGWSNEMVTARRKRFQFLEYVKINSNDITRSLALRLKFLEKKLPKRVQIRWQIIKNNFMKI